MSQKSTNHHAFCPQLTLAADMIRPLIMEAFGGVYMVGTWWAWSFHGGLRSLHEELPLDQGHDGAGRPGEQPGPSSGDVLRGFAQFCLIYHK
jgi:hypothetical protein